MSCCWRPISQQLAAMRSDGNPLPHRDANGVVALQGYEDCTQPYTGPRKVETVYIVGWSTEHERLFPANRARDAVVYRNDTDKTLSIDQVQAGNLCALAVEELWA